MAITSKKLRKAAAQLMDTLSRVPEHELQNSLKPWDKARRSRNPFRK